MTSRTYKAGIASRIAVASVGGYTLSASVAIYIALILPIALSEAVMVGTLLSFGVFAVWVIWAFAAPTPGRVWVWFAGLMIALWTHVLLYNYMAAPS